MFSGYISYFQPVSQNIYFYKTVILAKYVVPCRVILRTNIHPVPAKLKIQILRWSVTLIAAFVIPAGTLLAQVVATANVQASIVKADISILSLSSPHGTQFLLQNSSASCYDVSVNGLQNSLEGERGIQQVSYELNLDEAQQVSKGITRISLGIRFSEPVREGVYHATDPYTLRVNYN